MLDTEILSKERSAIGKKLEDLRNQSGLSAYELAKRVDCSQSTISRIESGKFFPAMDQLLSILYELGYTIEFVKQEAPV